LLLQTVLEEVLHGARTGQIFRGETPCLVIIAREDRLQKGGWCNSRYATAWAEGSLLSCRGLSSGGRCTIRLFRHRSPWHSPWFTRTYFI